MIALVVGGVLILLALLILAVSLAATAGRADQRLEQMRRDEPQRTPGGWRL